MSKSVRRPAVPPPVMFYGPVPGALSQLQVIAACVNADDTMLSALIPHADAELPGLFAGTGSVMGFADESIHASACRVRRRGYSEESDDDSSLTASAFALGFVVAARLFGGVR